MSPNHKTPNADPPDDTSPEAASNAALTAAAITTPIARLLIKQGRAAVYTDEGALVYVAPTRTASPHRRDDR